MIARDGGYDKVRVPRFAFGAPWTRNGHKIGGEFLFEVAKLLVVGFSRDARESSVGHLGPDGLSGYRIGHGADLSASTKGWRAMRANDESKAGDEGAGADAVDVRGKRDGCRNSCKRSDRDERFYSGFSCEFEFNYHEGGSRKWWRRWRLKIRSVLLLY